MKKIHITVIFTSLLITYVLFPVNLLAQKSNGHQLVDQVLLYIEGGDLNDAYLRKQIPFVNFVREPQLSNVQVLITSVGNAAGADQLRISFIGHQSFKDKDIELKHVTQQHQTEMEIQQELVRLIRMGLMPYIAQTKARNSISLLYNAENKDTSRTEEKEDPWNFWVFEIGGDLWYEEEETQKEYMLSGSADFDRVTEKWRLRNNIDYDIRFREFTDDNNIIQSTNQESEFNTSVVKSISDRWSGGFFVGWESSNFTNIKNSTYVSPAIEYNIFPWEEVDRREFTIAYSAGIQRNNYYRETIFGKMQENLLYERLYVQFEMIKPWGDMETRISASHYFHDINLNNIEINSQISFRITRYLFFDIEAGFEMIHDQLYLQKDEASLEDILLEQRKLATTYEFEFEIGFDIRFGSIYNNIINNRF